jgi:hypothetical protein
LLPPNEYLTACNETWRKGHKQDKYRYCTSADKTWLWPCTFYVVHYNLCFMNFVTVHPSCPANVCV